MYNLSSTLPVWFESAGRKGLRYETEDLDEGSTCFIIIKCVHVCVPVLAYKKYILLTM